MHSSYMKSFPTRILHPGPSLRAPTVGGPQPDGYTYVFVGMKYLSSHLAEPRSDRSETMS